MNYYGELLDTIFTTLTDKESPEILSLSDLLGKNQSERIEGSFSSVCVNSFERSSTSRIDLKGNSVLVSNEDFIRASIGKIAKTKANCLFAYTPMLNRRSISHEFQEHYGSLEADQILTTSFAFPSNSSDGPPSPFLNQHIANNNLEIFACLTNTHFISSSRSGPWRKDFFPRHGAVIIEHDHDLNEMINLSDTSRQPRLCTVIFQKKQEALRFFKVDDKALSHGKDRLLTDITRLLKQPKGKTKFGFVHSGPIIDRYPTTFDFYCEQTQLLRDDVKNLGEKVRLCSIADVLQPGSKRIDRGEKTLSDPEKHRFVRAANITSDNRVDLSEIKQSPTGLFQVTEFLQEGDFCISKISPANRGLKIGVFEGDGESVTWRDDIIVVRPHPRLTPVQRDVLLRFLCSPMAKKLINAKTGTHGVLRIRPEMLEEFPVPIADKEIVSALERLEEARSGFTQWIKEIEDAVDSIVEGSSAANSRKIILNSGQLSRQRYAAGHQVEDLDYRIRTLFPLPISHLWREVQVSGPDELHRLRAIKKAAEGHTCFMAQLAILLGTINGKPIRYLKSIAKRLQNGNGGTNFGDWFSIVKEACERRDYKSLAPNTPLEELTRIIEDSDWEQSIRHLMDLRNDDDHCRLSSHSPLKEILNEAQSALEKVFHATEFLTDYRLISITETRFDSIRNINRYQFLSLIGDNPLAKRDQGVCDRRDLESGSLYLKDRTGNLHLLRPLLHYLECPECHQMATFYFDSWNKRDESQTTLKSIERNSVRHCDLTFEFKQAGFLPSEQEI